MINNLIATAPSGRTGLAEVDITPIDYLYLMNKLESGAKLNFNVNQLQLAFKKYLDNHPGPWTNKQSKDLSGLDKLAIDYVAKKQEEYNDKKESLTGLSPKEEAKEKQALLQKLGLMPNAPAALSANMRSPYITSGQKQDNYLCNFNAGTDIVQAIYLFGEPTTTVALSLATMALQSSLSNALYDMMIRKYEAAAHNPEEKTVIGNFLSKMAPEHRHQLSDKIDHIQKNETHVEHSKKLNEIKPETADKKAEEKKLEFLDNSNMTKVPVFTKPEAPAQKTKVFDPLSFLSLKDGPKPPSWANEETQ